MPCWSGSTHTRLDLNSENLENSKSKVIHLVFFSLILYNLNCMKRCFIVLDDFLILKKNSLYIWSYMISKYQCKHESNHTVIHMTSAANLSRESIPQTIKLPLPVRTGVHRVELCFLSDISRDICQRLSVRQSEKTWFVEKELLPISGCAMSILACKFQVLQPVNSR